MGIEEVTAVKDVHNAGVDEEFVVCEQTAEIGGEQSTARIKAPPQLELVWHSSDMSLAVVRVEVLRLGAARA